MKEIVLGAGCFWCVEAVFDQIAGVNSVESGYSGGHIENPTYEQICTKTSGHVEVTKLIYDSKVISLEKILEVFWHSHNPTTKDQQGNDIGPQYRSVIFYQNEEQKAIAQKSLAVFEKKGDYKNKIVTEIAPLINYYKAENYHQNYFERVGDQNPYCTYVIKPKVKKVKDQFKDSLKE